MKTGFLSFVLATIVIGVRATNATDPEAVWDLIQPSDNLTWTPCYTSGYECARFLVPLDYTNSTDSRQAVVALIRFPSPLTKEDKNYRGPILLNPGGPGGSGVDFVAGVGAPLQQLFGTEYDIVGFDPRGVGRTTPALHGFTSTAELTTFAIKVGQDPLLGTTPGSVARSYARFASYGNVAKTRLEDVAPYVSTAFVARDMLAVTKAHGFPKLSYWGISYGTVLGMTFSSMFPQNVGRVIVDGVVDALDYYSAEWSRNLLDTDKILDYFYENCVKAGSNECAIYEKTTQQVRSRVERIFNHLEVQPIPVAIGTGPLDYGLVDYSMVRAYVFTFLYNPFLLGGKNVSTILLQLEKGDGSSLFAMQEPSTVHCDCDPNVRQVDIFSPLATVAIACSDGDVVNDSVQQLQKWYQNNKKESSFADSWPFRIACAGWKIRPAEKFPGTRIGANTSFPLLFIGNTADPVTPLAGAKKMSQLFSKSALLTVDTPGHSSLAAVSSCSLLAVQSYIRDGVLPKPGTVCSIESQLFGNSTTSAISARDEISSALRDLSERLIEHVPLFGHFGH